MNCNDCDHKQSNPDGGFCYMFFNHFKMHEYSGPLAICAKFKTTETLEDQINLITKAIENGNKIIS